MSEPDQDARLRDHFAAAALTGLLSNVQRYQNEPLTRQAFEIADFMLRERANHIPDAGKMVKTPTIHDAAPAARADLPDERPLHAVSASGGTPSAASRDGSGTGDTPVTEPLLQRKLAEVSAEPAAWYVRDRAAGPPMLFWDEERAKKAAFACGVGARPLYLCQDLSQKNLTLTDAEREAIRFCVTASLPETEKLCGVAGELCRMHAATLRGLLERL